MVLAKLDIQNNEIKAHIFNPKQKSTQRGTKNLT